MPKSNGFIFEEVAQIKLEMFCKTVSDQNLKLMICMLSVVKFKTSLAKEEVNRINFSMPVYCFLGNGSCS